MPTIEPERVVIPFHALFRCVERTKTSMDEATSVIREVLGSDETVWYTKPPKGVLRKERQSGVYYGAHEGHGVLVVFDENDRSGNGYVPTTYRWDSMTEEAKV